jgi:LacI family transcriptional regulator
MQMKHPKKQPVTMAMIAKEAGVGRTTVSFVLNGQAERHNIADKTIKRVEEIAQRLKYVPNSMALNLRRRRSGLIGVLLTGIGSEWAALIMRGLQDILYAQKHPYFPLLATHYFDQEIERREIQFFLKSRVEAIISAPTMCSENYRDILDRHVPLVFVGHVLPDLPQASLVQADGREAVRAGIDHLIEIGRRKIAYLGWEMHELLPDRQEGFRLAMSEAGLDVREEWVQVVRTRSEWDSVSVELQQIFSGKGEKPVAPLRSESNGVSDKLQRIFSGDGEKPDAIFIRTNRVGLLALEYLENMGLRVPEDVALIALEDNVVLRLSRIGLSAVVPPTEKIGQEAARAALELIRNPDSGPIRRSIQGFKVMQRNSTRVGEGRGQTSRTDAPRAGAS